MDDYPIVIAPLAADEGGGFVGYAPDLLGCLSDGETPEEALLNTREAITEWLETARRRAMKIPAPGSSALGRRRERQLLVARLKKLEDRVEQFKAGFEQFESRLDELELMVREMVVELEEKAENDDAWDRCCAITGMGSTDQRQRIA